MAEINPKVTQIAIPAKGGVPAAITMTMMASRVEVMEDPSLNDGVAQGLTGFYTDTQPATGFPNVGPQLVWLPQTTGQVGVAFQPIMFGGDKGRVCGGVGEYVGADGTVVLRLTTNSQNAGGVLLVEYP